MQFAMHWQEHREELPFQIDGVVIKVNALSEQQRVGFVAKSPLGGPSPISSRRNKHETRLLGDHAASGTGMGTITPVGAELEPVPLTGITIRRATLHNADEIERKDIRIGDMVLVERGGEVIPKVVGVDTGERPKSAKPFKFPSQLPGVRFAVGTPARGSELVL